MIDFDSSLERMDLYKILLLCFSAFVFSLVKTDACETLPSNLHIIKEIYGTNGILQRTCEGNVAVSKCEGGCDSKVRPSAISHSGFIKECHCCRETILRARDVLLRKCYDADGGLLHGEYETYTMSLREPADCKCFRCGDPPIN